MRPPDLEALGVMRPRGPWGHGVICSLPLPLGGPEWECALMCLWEETGSKFIIKLRRNTLGVVYSTLITLEVKLLSVLKSGLCFQKEPDQIISHWIYNPWKLLLWKNRNWKRSTTSSEIRHTSEMNKKMKGEGRLISGQTYGKDFKSMKIFTIYVNK